MCRYLTFAFIQTHISGKKRQWNLPSYKRCRSYIAFNSSSFFRFTNCQILKIRRIIFLLANKTHFKFKLKQKFKNLSPMFVIFKITNIFDGCVCENSLFTKICTQVLCNKNCNFYLVARWKWLDIKMSFEEHY